MSPRAVRCYRVRGEFIVQVLVCGCEHLIKARGLSKAVRTPKGDVDLSKMPSSGQCAGECLARGPEPQEAA